MVVQRRFLVLHGHAAFFDGVAGGFVPRTVVGLVLVAAVGHDLAAGAEKEILFPATGAAARGKGGGKGHGWLTSRGVVGCW